ncbi:MAG: DUF2188 domain-containing protein [Trueperaceae bacterium]
MIKQKSQHVVLNPNGGWSVRKFGASKARKVFREQTDAIEYARDLAKREHTELYIHRRDGTIREKKSYRVGPRSERERS